MRYATRIVRWVQVVAVLAAAGIVHPAMAQAPAAEPADAGYINVLPHYVDVDANRRGTTDDGHGIAVGYGHPLAGKWSWEFQLFEDVFAIDPSFLADFHRYGAGFDLNYRFRRDGVTPFVVLGVGAARNEVFPSTLNDTDYFGNAAHFFFHHATHNHCAVNEKNDVNKKAGNISNNIANTNFAIRIFASCCSGKFYTHIVLNAVELALCDVI